MEKSTKLILIGLSVAGIAAYYYTKSKQAPTVPLGGLSVSIHPDYFRRLAKQREKQYKHAVGQIKQLEAKNEDMWNELQQNLKNQIGNNYGGYGGYGGGIFPVSYPPPTAIAPLQQQSPQLNNVSQMIDDSENEMDQEDNKTHTPNMSVGPVVRKLNY